MTDNTINPACTAAIKLASVEGARVVCQGCGKIHEPYPQSPRAFSNLGYSADKVTPMGTSLRIDEIRMLEQQR